MNQDENFLQPSVITAKELFRFKNISTTIKPPEIMLLCFVDSLFARIIKKFKNTKINGFYGDVRILKKFDNKIGIVGKFGIGSPVTAVLTEDFHEWGVKTIIGIGMGSSIHPDIRIGDIILVDKSIRDEGTSFHYESASKYSFSSNNLLAHVKEECQFTHRKVIIGSTWTTDAVYREINSKITEFQKENILAVEMECSCLYSVANYCKMRSLFLLCVSDSVATLQWEFKNNINELIEDFSVIIEELMGYLINEH